MRAEQIPSKFREFARDTDKFYDFPSLPEILQNFMTFSGMENGICQVNDFFRFAMAVGTLGGKKTLLQFSLFYAPKTF